MNQNLHAFIMGFNQYKDNARLPQLKYAEKDAFDFYNLLADPQVGGYAKNNIVLIAGNPTTREVEEALYSRIVTERTPEDIVIVYYSGLGFLAGDKGKAYLGMPDTSVLDVLKNPRSGLSMEFLHDEIFMKSRAKHVLLFLDCAHSGAFIPLRKDDASPKIRQDMIDNHSFILEGRAAFVSSPRGVASRESTEFRNGIFTHHLLDGLRGKAADISGEVSLDSLVSYTKSVAPASQPPVFYGRITGRLVLTTPSEEILSREEFPTPEDYKHPEVLHPPIIEKHFPSIDGAEKNIKGAPIKVFISYKHQDVVRNKWVEQLYKDLRFEGIDAKLDKYEVAPGESLSHYMSHGIGECDSVLFIITPEAVKSVESGKGALAFEMQISNARRLASKDGFRIIPIFREGKETTSYLSDHLYLDFRIDEDYNAKLELLIQWLVGEITPPPLGKMRIR